MEDLTTMDRPGTPLRAQTAPPPTTHKRHLKIRPPYPAYA